MRILKLPFISNFSTKPSPPSLFVVQGGPPRPLPAAELPEIQTLSLWSTYIPCSLFGQMQPASALHLPPMKPGSDGPPQARNILPSASNSRTEGAALQQSATGPYARTCPMPLIGCPFSSLAPATGPSSPASSVVMVRGRL